jgi:Rho GDP-dissociation inhibitor
LAARRWCLAANTGNQIEGRPDIVIDLSQPGQLETLKDKPFNIKEGTTFRMSVRFKVQHQILSGMKYLQVVKRMGISSKTQEMIVRRQPHGDEC